MRRTRTAVVAGALAILTLAGHAAGSGGLTLTSIAAILLLSTSLAVATTRRALTWWRALVVLLGGQALLHVVMTFTAAHDHPSTAIDAPMMVLGHVVASLIAAAIVLHIDALLARWRAYLSSVLGAASLDGIAPLDEVAHCAPTASAAGSTMAGLGAHVRRRGPPRAVAMPA